MLRTPRYIPVSLIALALAGAKPSCAAGQADAAAGGDTQGAAAIPAPATVTAAAKPVFSLGSGTYASAQSVTLTDATAGFVIHYTINGTAPTAASTQYKAPIKVASTKTIKAIAVAAGHANSAVASATYNIAATGIVATPASFTFPVVTLGEKAVATAVTLKNTGSTAVTSLSITLAGAAASAYSKSQTCGATLAAGASCTVSVTFKPKTSGYMAAAVQVTGSGARSASVSIDALCTDLNAQATDDNTYKFSTSQGDIFVVLRPDVAPKNVANFLHYVNNGTYAKSIIHRVVANFADQGGGYTLNSDGQIIESKTVAPVVNEFKLSNVRGTLAMVKSGASPNSATDQFFFNVANNTALDTQSGGYTVIGQIVGVQGVERSGSASLAVMDAINADNVYQFNAPFDSIPLVNYVSGAVAPSNFVYVNSITKVLPRTGAPATPVFSIAGGTYKGPQSVSLTDSTPGATIYYYLFGSPIHEVVTYKKPFKLSKSQYAVAIAVAPGYPNPSYLNYENYTITAP